jgi:hypothetical protein
MNTHPPFVVPDNSPKRFADDTGQHKLPQFPQLRGSVTLNLGFAVGSFPMACGDPMLWTLTNSNNPATFR